MATDEELREIVARARTHRYGTWEADLQHADLLALCDAAQQRVERLAEAFRAFVCPGQVIDGRCFGCGSRHCADARALLGEAKP